MKTPKYPKKSPRYTPDFPYRKKRKMPRRGTNPRHHQHESIEAWVPRSYAGGQRQDWYGRASQAYDLFNRHADQFQSAGSRLGAAWRQWNRAPATNPSGMAGLGRRYRPSTRTFGPSGLRAGPQNTRNQQRKNLTRWGGAIINKYPMYQNPKSAKTAKGQLTLKTNKKRLRSIYKNLPQTVFQKHYLSTNSLTTTGEVGYRDWLYSNSSKSAAHLAIVYFKIMAAEQYWKNNTFFGSVSNTYATPVGNHLIDLTYAQAVDANFIGQVNASADGLEDNIESMVTINRVPNGGGGRPPTDDYLIPNSVLKYVQINMKFHNAGSVVRQTINIKLCRFNGVNPRLYSDVTGYDEVFNKQTVVDGKVADIIYSHSFTLMPTSTTNTAQRRVHSINKKIVLNLSRSTCRKTSVPGTAEYGIMASPQFGIDASGKMYNDCILIVTSRCMDDNYIEDKRVTIANDPVVAGETQTIFTPKVTPLTATTGTGNVLVGTDFAKFAYTGTITIGHNVQDYLRQSS